jgi:hypothetical protein
MKARNLTCVGASSDGQGRVARATRGWIVMSDSNGKMRQFPIEDYHDFTINNGKVTINKSPLRPDRDLSGVAEAVESILRDAHGDRAVSGGGTLSFGEVNINFAPSRINLNYPHDEPEKKEEQCAEKAEEDEVLRERWFSKVVQLEHRFTAVDGRVKFDVKPSGSDSNLYWELHDCLRERYGKNRNGTGVLYSQPIMFTFEPK